MSRFARSASAGGCQAPVCCQTVCHEDRVHTARLPKPVRRQPTVHLALLPQPPPPPNRRATMTSWAQVAKCWKVDNGDDFDAKALELYFPASKDHEGAEARKAIWKAMDNNGNKYVSLGECTHGWFNQHTGQLETKAGRKPVAGKVLYLRMLVLS